MTTVVITPLSPHPDAIASTVRTLESLPMAGFVHTMTRGGLIFGTATAPDFLRFACEQQGYAKSVNEVDPDALQQLLDYTSRENAEPERRPAESHASSYVPMRPEELYASATYTPDGRAKHRLMLVRTGSQENT